jgi:hypothetical protein
MLLFANKSFPVHCRKLFPDTRRIVCKQTDLIWCSSTSATFSETAYSLHQLINAIHRNSTSVRINLFDCPHHLKFSTGVEMVTLLAQEQLQMPGNIATSNVCPHHTMRHSKAFVDRHSMCHAVTSIKYDASCTTGGVTNYAASNTKDETLLIFMILSFFFF